MFEIGQEEIDAVAQVINSRQLFRYRGGEDGQATACETRLKEIFGCSEAIVMTSGTAALICGLTGLGIGPGDEVIVPAYTWLASAGAVLSVGAIPVLADVDETLTLDPAAFEDRIGPRTKAVIPVHMAGRPANMGPIMDIAKKHGLAVLEDSCQAIGGSYKGQRLGTIGDAGALSFNMFKIISCGEGGALLTSNRKVFERALYYHDMGCTFREHTLTEEPFLGNTFRMNEILSAVLHVQLGRLDGILARLRERRQWTIAAVENKNTKLRVAPSSDHEGDCGVQTSFIFSSAKERELVAERAAELGCNTASPINHGMHVHTNWKVLLEKKGALHPAMNPFLREENRDCRMDITPDTCTRTLDLLARSATLGTNIAATREECEERAAKLCQAAGEILG
ncbi:MAG: DegT/DnrJ/EryC1/StrS family aminotransferase [Kiritimatiellia bacterium]|nr:DegT/DnrJ/EryC1/StrS family aminotransferase [Lentisphaerota bacterium]